MTQDGGRLIAYLTGGPLNGLIVDTSDRDELTLDIASFVRDGRSVIVSAVYKKIHQRPNADGEFWYQFKEFRS